MTEEFRDIVERRRDPIEARLSSLNGFGRTWPLQCLTRNSGAYWTAVELVRQRNGHHIALLPVEFLHGNQEAEAG
jgi:hypothetical protein